MTDHGKTLRVGAGAALMAGGALVSSVSTLAELMLVFGGGLFAAGLSGQAHAPAVRREWLPPMPQAALAQRATATAGAEDGRSRRGMAAWAAVACVLVLAGGGAFVYPLLTRIAPPSAQATQAPAHPANVTGGRAVAPRHDPQLHKAAVGQRFVLSHAAITVAAASMCRRGDAMQVTVPATVAAIKEGVAVREPLYRLVDADGNPHEATAIAALDRPRAVAGHAAPPPKTYRQSMRFTVPVKGADGTLRLEAALPSGSGAFYRVTVADGRGAQQACAPTKLGAR